MATRVTKKSARTTPKRAKETTKRPARKATGVLTPYEKAAIKSLRSITHDLKVMAFEAITNPVDAANREGCDRLHKFYGMMGRLNAVEQAMSKGPNAWPPRLSGGTGA